jgi:hypothetical protein
MSFSTLSSCLRKHLNYDWLEGKGREGNEKDWFKPNFWEGRLKISLGLITDIL